MNPLTKQFIYYTSQALCFFFLGVFASIDMYEGSGTPYKYAAACFLACVFTLLLFREYDKNK